MITPVPRAPRLSVPASKPRMHGKDRRRQLLEVAVEVFARQGFGGTKTKDIAAAAGVSEAMLFRHFASKEDLYHAILDAREDKLSAQDLLKKLQTYADRRDDAGLFSCVASAILSSFREDAAFHRLMLYASLEGHLLAGLFRERFGLPIFDYLRRYVILRQKEGAFRKGDAHIAVMFATGSIMHFAMVRHIFHVRKPNVSEDAAVREMVDMALAGLAGPLSQNIRERKVGRMRRIGRADRARVMKKASKAAERVGHA